MHSFVCLAYLEEAQRLVLDLERALHATMDAQRDAGAPGGLPDVVENVVAVLNRAVLDVAIACGFASTSHFTKCYRERYHCTPTEERQSYFWAQGGRKPARAAVAPARIVTAP